MSNMHTMPPPPAPAHGPVEYDLTVRQQPKQARMCGVGGKADRRPIDPPPIVQLVVRGTGDDRAPSLGFLQNPYYFMFASLAKPDDDSELHWLKDGRTRCTIGSVVSSLYHLKDKDEDVGFFVFPDVSVRTEGSYRLKLSLFEVTGSVVKHCKSIFSSPFYVYTAKKFPGMEQSTQLSCVLADQGIKIRIRKDIRVRNEKGQKRARIDEEADEQDTNGVVAAIVPNPAPGTGAIPPPPGAQQMPPTAIAGTPPGGGIPPPPGATHIQAQGYEQHSTPPQPQSQAPAQQPHPAPSGAHMGQEYYHPPPPGPPGPYDYYYHPPPMWHYPPPHAAYGYEHAQRPPAPYYYPAWGTPPGWVPPPGGEYGAPRDYPAPPREYGRGAEYGRDYRPAEYGPPVAFAPPPGTQSMASTGPQVIPPPPGAVRIGTNGEYDVQPEPQREYNRAYVPPPPPPPPQPAPPRDYAPPRQYSPPPSRREYVAPISRSGGSFSGPYFSPTSAGPPSAFSSTGFAPASSSTGSFPSAGSTGSFAPLPPPSAPPSASFQPPSSYPSSPQFSSPTATTSGSFSAPFSNQAQAQAQGNKLSIGSILRKDRD